MPVSGILMDYLGNILHSEITRIDYNKQSKFLNYRCGKDFSFLTSLWPFNSTALPPFQRYAF